VPFERVIEAAREARERLEASASSRSARRRAARGCTSSCRSRRRVARRSTGKPRKEFARALCMQMAADSPERYVVNMSEEGARRADFPRLPA
jgi:bifunctional non-homologous end joining protein LigD